MVNSGLYNYGVRYYDDSIGRFVTEDSLTGSRNDPLSLNRYAYARDNPERYEDPTGHFMHSSIIGEGSDPNVVVTTTSACVDGVCTITTVESYDGYTETITTVTGTETDSSGNTVTAMSASVTDVTPTAAGSGSYTTTTTSTWSETTTSANGQSVTVSTPPQTSSFQSPDFTIHWNPNAAQSMTYFVAGGMIMGASYLSGVPSFMIASTATQVEVGNYIANTPNPDPNYVLALYFEGYGGWAIGVGLRILMGFP